MSHLEEVTAQKEARQFPDVMLQAMILHLIDSYRVLYSGDIESQS